MRYLLIKKAKIRFRQKQAGFWMPISIQVRPSRTLRGEICYAHFSERLPNPEMQSLWAKDNVNKAFIQHIEKLSFNRIV
jgi:hypothetical protein